MEQPSPHQSHPFLPRWRPLQAAARTVTLETRTVFVTIMYLPPWTIPRPRPPCWTRRLPQARISTERYSPGLARNLQPGHAGHPGSFWNWGRLRLSSQAPPPKTSCPEDHLGTLGTSLPSLPSPGALRPQRPPSLEESGPRASLQAPRREAQSSGAR